MYSLNRFGLLSLLALFDWSFAEAQLLRPYVPMAIEGAHWAMDAYQGDNGVSWYMGRYHYLVHGDSVVNGYSYKKLYSCPKLVALIRDDTTFRKVMLFPLDTQTTNMFSLSICPGVREVLLYDFNLSVGDTLKNCWQANRLSLWGPNAVLRVASNDTMTLFGKNRNVLWTNFGSLVDGIGNPRTGIFPHNCLFETCFRLAYYNVLNVTGCADPKVGLEDIGNPILEARIFPNPVQHIIQIRIPDVAMRKTYFSLCDLTGRVLKKGVFEGNQHSISVDDMANGVYMLRLESQNQSVTLKTIIFN